MDILSPSERSRIMTLIRSKDTKPEMVVRRLVHRLGYRYRLHVRTLPGCPDLVLPSRRSVVFVHGCFWHMHSCSQGRSTPRTNAAFWAEKRTGNAARDSRNTRRLRRLGWRVLVVWECQLKELERLAARIAAFLDG